jgi:glutamate N-acetyltransferase/amino-acid N-acetyltransferase
MNDGSITSVNGIKSAGIHSGVKRKRKDLALIVSDSLCTAVGTYTLNKAKAAPVSISKNITDNGGKVKALLVNSGNANACTGERGYSDALGMQKCCAEKLNVSPNKVLISSTGIIGKYLEIDKIKEGINGIIPKLSYNGGTDSAEAIMTTDIKKKEFALKVQLEKGEVTIGGIAKGSGMIMPNMATMLGFLATDALIDNNTLKKLLKNSVNKTFNKISVDGETSTNDMVVMIANGANGISINENTDDYKKFQSALDDICTKMAKAIVGDGEGATKLVTININNAKSNKDADLIAKALANSPLFKTAIYGEDANWGRIISAAGASEADIVPEKTSILINDLPILDPNYKIITNGESLKNALSGKEIIVTVDLHNGSSSTTWWTCDYSEQYIKINAHYTT